MRNLFTRRRVAVAAAAAAVALGAGTVLAYWTTGGSGTGHASAGSVVGVTVNQTTSLSGMYPGQAPQSLAGNFSNSNAGPVHVSSVTAVVSSVSGGAADGSKPSCTPADFAISGTATEPAGSELAPTTGSGTTGAWSGLSIQLVDRADATADPSASPSPLPFISGNQDNCKNATANITYTANP